MSLAEEVTSSYFNETFGEPYAGAAVMDSTDADNQWMLQSGYMVFFMQAGFAMVEGGFTRAKNVGNIMMKNLMDFSFGTLCVGLFASAPYGLSSGVGGVTGLFYGGGWSLLGIQALGVAAAFAWVIGTSLVLFSLIKATMGLRVSRDEELRGMDIGEHGIESYSGFQVFTTQ